MTKITILGCGSSLGSPWITNYWGKLNKKNKFNFRTRCSAHIKKGDLSILIDTSPDIKKQILDKLIFRFNSVLRAKRSKYILMNVPNDKIKTVSTLLPVLKSPTILPLQMDGWSSLHTVIDDDKFWESIDIIKDAGAEDILVCPIEKMVL